MRYQHITLIGEGGLARVYSAFDRVRGHKVAIKVLHRNLADQVEQVKRFRREFEVLRSLRDPALPEVYEQGLTPKGEPYFTCQLIAGRSMAEWIEDWKAGKNPWTLAKRVEVARRLCQALRNIHSQGVLHRDIKPENIMLGTEGEVYLLDWGLAASEVADDAADRLTADNTFLGTLRYAAPEQIQGRRSIDNDVFSLGATLYELFTLQPAHPGQEVHEVINSVLMREPVPADQIAPVPLWLSSLLSRMLKKHPTARTRCLHEIEEALEAADRQAVASARRCGPLVSPIGLAS